MAFEFLRAENDAAPIEKEIIATNGTTYKHGVLVSFGSAGTAVVSSGTAVPEFVYAGKEITAKTGDKLAVIPVLRKMEYSGHLCHRVYDLSALREAGIRVPQTSLRTGLRRQLQALGELPETEVPG